MPKLSDGSYIQSNLTMKGASAYQTLRQNVALRTGIVTNIYYPDDANNVSGKFIEYDVAVSEQLPGGGTTISTYRNCKVSNMFGADNNNSTYTLQADTDLDQDTTNAAIVTLLCIDGRSDGGQAMIMGGLNSPNGPAYTSADGQFYDFNFNGINYNINKDGEWTITFSSPIDEEGNQSNKAAAGTMVKIDKDGRVKISDNEGQSWDIDRVAKTSTWTNGNDSILIDKGNKKIALTSSGELSSTSEKATTLTSNDAMNINATNDINVSGKNNVNTTSSANMMQKSGGNWQVQATGNVQVQAGGDVNIQANGQAQLNGTINLIGNGSVPVAAVGVSMVLGVGNLGAPVISQILTGSSTVLVGT